MYIQTYEPYAVADTETAIQAIVFRTIFLAIRYREPDPRSGRPIPLVPLGLDPARHDAARALNRFIEENYRDGKDRERQLRLDGTVAHFDPATFELADELIRTWIARFAGIDNEQQVHGLLEFMDPNHPAKEGIGGTRKLSADKYAQEMREEQDRLAQRPEQPPS